MRTLRSFLGLVLIVGMVSACQQDAAIGEEFNLAPEISEIAAEELPQLSQTYIVQNFMGEIVTSAYRLTWAGDTYYEAFLTNDLNLVFDEDGDLIGFGEAGARLTCDGSPGEGLGGRHGRRGRGRHHGDRDSTNVPTEIAIEDLPTGAQSYVAANYPDGEVLKVLEKVRDEETTYHVLVAEVGALIFDADGGFIGLRERRGGGCAQFEEVELAELPEAVTTYVATNYPDNEVLGARIGTIDEVVQIHVKVADAGVLIFDEEGAFVELKTCGMRG